MLLVCLAVPRLESQAAESFAAAIVSEDGLLVPFARFDGTTWERIWPEPGEKAEAPPSLNAPAAWFPPDGDVPATWHLWLLDDPRAAASPFEHRTGRVVKVEKADVFDAHCLKQVGLRVDYRGAADRQPAPNTFPRKKAGVALSVESIRVDPATVLDPASPLARIVSDRASQAFHRAEEDHLEILDARERAQLPELKARRAAPVKWTKVMRLGTAQAPERTYYLEGEVAYSARSIMAGHVWVQIAGDRDTVDAEALLTDEDRKQGVRRVSIGVIRVGDRRFWVFETNSWEHETYEIVEASGQGQRPISLLEVAAGGC
jgi:hypothetical protein